MPGPRSDIDRAWRELLHHLKTLGIDEPSATAPPSCDTPGWSYAAEVIVSLNDLRRRDRLRSFDVRLIKRIVRAIVNHVLGSPDSSPGAS